MKTNILFSLIVFIVISGCDPDIIDPSGSNDPEKSPLGKVQINFVYKIQGIPDNKLSRADLSLAYSADSLYRGQFFTSTNVSDAVQTYYFYLPPGKYFYQATLICLSKGDSCRLAGFNSGEYGLMMDGFGFTIKKDETTIISTQFH
jgi:hypothetical protein